MPSYYRVREYVKGEGKGFVLNTCHKLRTARQKAKRARLANTRRRRPYKHYRVKIYKVKTLR